MNPRTDEGGLVVKGGKSHLIFGFWNEVRDPGKLAVSERRMKENEQRDCGRERSGRKSAHCATPSDFFFFSKLKHSNNRYYVSNKTVEIAVYGDITTAR